MKKLLTLYFMLSAVVSNLSGQAPQLFSYQGTIRNASGGLVVNQQVALRISILRDSVTGNVEYSETHTATTTDKGVVGIQIGGGLPTKGEFSMIDWGASSHYLKTETDPAGGSSYTIVGVTRLMSVPYAKYANDGGMAESASVAKSIDVRVSLKGDTLYFGKSGMAVIKGLSEANPPPPPVYVHCLSGGDTTVVNPVTSTTGKVWMDRNLDAARAATSATDTLAYGGFYQWGRFADGHQCRNRLEKYSGIASNAYTIPGSAWYGKWIIGETSEGDWLKDPDSTLWTGVDGLNNPCPSGYRVPTASEWEAETLSWTPTTATGAYASALKIPLGGGRDQNSGLPVVVGISGTFWSSTVAGSQAIVLGVSGSKSILNQNDRGVGRGLRCIKD